MEVEDKSLRNTRRQYVAKRNDLVQRTRRSLTMTESKALSYILSKIKPDDTPDTVYRFDCQEFCRLLHWDTQSYKRIKHVLWDIASQTFIIVDADGTEKFAHWFNLVHLIKTDGAPKSENDIRGRCIEITIHQDLMQYVFDLRGQSENYYTMYRLQNIVLMRHPYSQSLYELLKSYQNGRAYSKWTFEIGTGTVRDIQMLLAMYKKVPVEKQGKTTARSTYHKEGDSQEYTLVPILPASWKKFTFFERDVIKPSVEEINRFTDIIVDYKAEKLDLQRRKTRRYSTITFFISAKSSAEQTQTDYVIDAEYEEGQAVQMTLAEYSAGFQERREEQKTAATESAGKAEEDRNEREEETRPEFPIIHDALSDEYSAEEIGYIIKAAQEHWRPGMSSWDARELWLCDYIQHYDAMVQATAKDTRTTNYRRLLNMCSKDYDEFADALAVKYKVPEKREVEAEDGADMSDEELEERIRQLQIELQKRQR